jgi:hypothetical protein
MQLRDLIISELLAFCAILIIQKIYQWEKKLILDPLNSKLRLQPTCLCVLNLRFFNRAISRMHTTDDIHLVDLTAQNKGDLET